MTANTPRPFPKNPNYGNGRYRRRIRLVNDGLQVIAELEDCNHGFRCIVAHNGEVVTEVRAETPRIPFTSCSGAVEPIKKLVGIRLDLDAKTITETVNPRLNCTHLYDLSVLAIGHALRDETERVYDIVVEDERDGEEAEAVVYRNGELVHRWMIQNWQVVEPAELNGLPLHKGFAAWANERFNGEEREAAFVLQKGCFVSTARTHDEQQIYGTLASDFMHIPGACHTYTPGIAEQAVRIADSVRDFSDSPEKLLAFE